MRFREIGSHLREEKRVLHCGMLLLGFAALLVLILMKFDQVWGAVSTVAGTVAPVFYGIAIAYILNVFVHFFEDVAFRPFRDSKSKAWAKVRRPLSVALAYLVVALVIVFIAAFIIPGMVESLSVLADTVQQNAPVYFNNAMAWLNNFAQENDLTFIEEFLAGFNWSTLLSSLTEVLRDFLSSLVGVTFNVASGVFAAVMGFIFSVYMLMGKEKLLRGVKSTMLAYLPKPASRKITQVASLLHQRGITPDFFSLCAVPYEPTLDEGAPAPYVISAHPDYIRDRVASIRRQVQDICGPVPIWVTVLSPDIRTRNHVNDSCYQATFFVKNTVDLIGLADLIGYWQLSDVDTEYKDTTRILFGGTGILSKDGLKKPGFTVLKRLHRMNTLLIQREGNMLVTTNAINTYNILLFNHAHFTDLYCLTNGEDVTCDNAYSVFKDAATRDISITLNGLLPGRYKLVITTLNRENGSLFDEWLHYGILDNLQPQDIQYLQDIVHPQRVVRHHLLEDGVLHLNVQMLPHEVKFLLLLREL